MTREPRGAGVKRQMVTVIECISANGRSLLIIIWQPQPIGAHGPRTLSLDGILRVPNLDIPTSLEWVKRVFDPQTRLRAN